MLNLVLRAKNSSGLHYLFIDKEEENKILLCLTGTYKDKPIQIDFDALTIEDIQDLITLLKSRLPKKQEKKCKK